jgi:hypothetical protein
MLTLPTNNLTEIKHRQHENAQTPAALIAAARCNPFRPVKIDRRRAAACRCGKFAPAAGARTR